MKESVLVFATHPDDETLGCGGTLLRLRDEGADIHWIIMTEMSPSRYSQQAIKRRQKEISNVAKLYNFASMHQLGFPASGLDDVPLSKIISSIAAVVNEVKPTMVFLPFLHDVHSDHQKCFVAAYSCTKVFRYPTIKKIMMFETLSETDFSCASHGGFVPNLFVNISNCISTKLKIMRVYKSELDKHPFPRSIDGLKALSMYRGINAGCKYAEAFVVLKEIL